jgi:hypothetical protein
MASSAQIEQGAKIYGIVMDGKALYTITAPAAGYGKLEIAYHNPRRTPLKVFLRNYGAAPSQEGWVQVGTISQRGGVWTHTGTEFIALDQGPGQQFLDPDNNLQVMLLLPGGSDMEDWTLCYINLVRFQFYDKLTPFHQAVEQQERAWLSEKQLLVSAEGRAPARIKGGAGRRAAAVRAATIVGQRKLLELLQQRTPRTNGKKRITGTLKGFTVKQVEYLGEGRARVVLAYPLSAD